MILLTSSSIPSSAMSNAGMGKNGQDSSWSMTDFSVSVPLQSLSLLDLKNMHLDLENVSLDI